jgi:uncharacterized spore protein YtfJ
MGVRMMSIELAAVYYSEIVQFAPEVILDWTRWIEEETQNRQATTQPE